ncbi:MAG: cytochrome P460 family protein [Halioglobus sp.]
MKTNQTLLTLLALGALTLSPSIASAESAYSIKDGELARPTGYREWVYVGTPVTPNDMNKGKAAFPEHHNVYIDPESWSHWKKTGEFRDGTILVKELVSVGSKAAVSGQGYFQGEFIGLEATIKSKADFPDEPGNWAYYSFSSKDHKTLSETATAFPTDSCNACHQNAAADDFVFTQYYPVLSAGKGAGRIAVGGHLSDLANGYIEPKGEE